MIASKNAPHKEFQNMKECATAFASATANLPFADQANDMLFIDNQIFLFFWLFTFATLTRFFVTLFDIPHRALATEIPDKSLITSLINYYLDMTTNI